jgi:hypothetical protein
MEGSVELHYTGVIQAKGSYLGQTSSEKQRNKFRSSERSYADGKRRDMVFQEGDYVYLKVSPIRGLRRFRVKGKLSPRFIGPFRILERVGEVAYRLELPVQLADVHDVFHLSVEEGFWSS